MHRNRVVRPILTALAAAMASASLAAPVTISMWNLWTGPDGADANKIVHMFNQSQSKYHVTHLTLPWGIPYYTKLETSWLAGKGPDVAVMHLSRMGSFAPRGLLAKITPADLKAIGVNPSGNQFYPLLWAHSHYQGKLYAIPIDSHPLVLYVNLTIAKKAGLLQPNGQLKPITSMAQYEADMAAAKKLGYIGEGLENTPGALTPWRLWFGLIHQMNAHLIVNGKPAWGQAGVTALQDMRTWVKDGYSPLNTNYNAQLNDFVGGRSLFMIDGVWERPVMVSATRKGELRFKYAMMTMPKFYQTDATWSDSHSFVMPASKYQKLSPQVKAGVLAFLNFWVHHEIVWTHGGEIPSFLPVIHSAAFKAEVPNNEYFSSAKIVRYEPQYWFSGAAGPMETDAGNIFPLAISGKMSVKAALAEFASKLEALMKQPAPK